MCAASHFMISILQISLWMQASLCVCFALNVLAWLTAGYRFPNSFIAHIQFRIRQFSECLGRGFSFEVCSSLFIHMYIWALVWFDFCRYVFMSNRLLESDRLCSRYYTDCHLSKMNGIKLVNLFHTLKSWEKVMMYMLVCECYQINLEENQKFLYKIIWKRLLN